MLRLAGINALDIAAYCVMSNYFYSVLYINTMKSECQAARQVLDFWHQLLNVSLRSQSSVAK